VELTISRGECPPDVDSIIDVVPSEAEDLFASESKPERKMDRRVPWVDPAHSLEDPSAERGVDHRERRSLTRGSVYE
jgi:hypothetical protein